MIDQSIRDWTSAVIDTTKTHVLSFLIPTRCNDLYAGIPDEAAILNVILSRVCQCQHFIAYDKGISVSDKNHHLYTFTACRASIAG